MKKKYLIIPLRYSRFQFVFVSICETLFVYNHFKKIYFSGTKFISVTPKLVSFRVAFTLTKLENSFLEQYFVKRTYNGIAISRVEKDIFNSTSVNLHLYFPNIFLTECVKTSDLQTNLLQIYNVFILENLCFN